MWKHVIIVCCFFVFLPSFFRAAVSGCAEKKKCKEKIHRQAAAAPTHARIYVM
jgi:hypothetical protein